MLNIKKTKMKNVLIIFMVLTTFAINAQNDTQGKRENRREMKENFTPEQKAELRAKQMVLELDLSVDQQKRVEKLFLEMGKNKTARPDNSKEMTSEEKYAAKNAMLDRRIAFKKQLKEILTEEQMTKWENAVHHSRKKGDHRMKQKSE